MEGWTLTKHPKAGRCHTCSCADVRVEVDSGVGLLTCSYLSCDCVLVSSGSNVERRAQVIELDRR